MSTSARSINDALSAADAEVREILRLADSDARWCEVHDDPIKKGATRRDQRDEKHPFHYDGTH